jgi:hypothetical protein
MKTMSKWLAAAVVVVLGTGCNYGAGAFNCKTDEQCGAGGTCEQTTGFCSLPDDSCQPSGRRYGDQAGGQSNKCVGEEQKTDAGPDPIIDASDAAVPPDAQACFGGPFLHICLAATPTQPLTISSATTIDTANPSMCAATVSGGTGYCVLAGTTISIGAKLRATGTKPLVLVASDSITILLNGSIDAGSHRGATPEVGAGSDPTTCVASTTLPGTAGGTYGGGAGGSFTGLGGDGGAGGKGGTGGAPAAGVSVVNALRGGCAGQDGGGAVAATAAKGGHGGGAVYLIAGTAITVAGTINAAGEGGSGGAAAGNAGGGAGGAGGMIGFDAPAITGTGLILANGGGGGEGSSSVNAGNPGGEPTTTAAALGGSNGSTVGGDGGNGSAGGAAGSGVNGTDGNNMNGGGGGGGGGGGAGHVKAPATATLGTMVSPAATP